MLYLNELIYISPDFPLKEKVVALCSPPIYLAENMADYCAEVPSLPLPVGSWLLSSFVMFYTNPIGCLKAPFSPLTAIVISGVGVNKAKEQQKYWVHDGSGRMEMRADEEIEEKPFGCTLITAWVHEINEALIIGVEEGSINRDVLKKKDSLTDKIKEFFPAWAPSPVPG